MIAKITRNNLPKYAMQLYRKKEPVRALFISQPFVVDMEGDGWAYCERGYLVLDPTGQPYAVPEKKFLAMYEAMDD